jgi:hypothetical protein
MKPFHYHEDPMYAAAAAILTQETVSEEAVQLDEGVEDIAAAVANFKKGDKTNFGVVTDVGTNSISFKAKDLPVTKIAFNQRKMGSKDFVLDKLVKLKEDSEMDEAVNYTFAKKLAGPKGKLPEGVELEEGVGDYSVRKTGSSVSKGEEDYEQDVTTTTYDIVKGGKIIGNLSTNDFMGGVYGKMYGKDLPNLEGYGSYTTSGVLGNLHKFLKSNTGMKWMAKNVKEDVSLDEAANITPVKAKYIFFIEDRELYQLSPYKLLATLKVGRTLEPLMSLVNSGSDWKAVSVARGEDLVEIGALKSPQDSDEVAQWYVVNSIYKGITHLALIH